METVDVLMKMPKIEGYEYTGEWRHVVDNEFFLSDATGTMRQRNEICNPCSPRPILRKAEIWRPLTLEKALEMGKARMLCTFRLVIPRIGYPSAVGTGFRAMVVTIDLDSGTGKRIRLTHYGWVKNSDLEYLEE